MTARLLGSVLALALVAGCSSPPPPKEPEPPKAAPEPEAELPADHIDRGYLEAVLREGPVWVLERVPVEEVTDKGKFVGWRVRELPPEWSAIELKPGDVVTAVNAMPVETPTDFWQAWTTLSVASELKVAYERDGEPLEMSFTIVGSPTPEVSQQLEQAPAPQPEQKRKDTVIIQGEDRPLSDTLTDWSDQ